MSSILDALKKLESEKSGKERPAERANIEAVAAERDLTRRRRSQPEGEIVRISSMVLILSGLAVIAVLVAVSAVAALIIVRTSEGQRFAESGQPQTSAPPIPTAPFQPVPAADITPAVPVPAPLEPVSSEPAVEGPALPVAPIEPVAPTPEPVARVKPEPPVVADNAPPVLAPAAETPIDQARVKAPIGEVDLTTLPVLTEVERIRLGLPRMKINIVGLPTKRQPRPSALIDFEKVYLGEYIKNSRARLIAVDLRGIGIEIGGNRYFMEK